MVALHERWETFRVGIQALRYGNDDTGFCPWIFFHHFFVLTSNSIFAGRLLAEDLMNDLL